MSCKSPKVEDVAKKASKATDQLNELENRLNERKQEYLNEFEKFCSDSLKKAGISDDRLMDHNDYVKTEYSYEFSLDKITNIVNSSLKTIQSVKNSKTENPALSDDAINSYCGLVNSVAEAAKSTSTASTTNAFAMNHIGKGLVVFLMARSTSMQQTETFGAESVSSTAIFYKCIESLEEVARETEFDSARIDSDIILRLKQSMLTLVTKLSEDKITLLEYYIKKTAFENEICEAEARLAKYKKPLQAAANFSKIELLDEVVLQSSYNMLCGKVEYKEAADDLKYKIKKGYFIPSF